MTVFFESLKAIEKVFLFSAVLGGLLFIVRMALSFLGSHHGGDMDVGGHDGGFGGHHGDSDLNSDSDSSFKVISLQGLTAFFMMFGLVGLALSKQSKFPESIAILGAIVGGGVAFWVIGKIFKGMGRLHSDGSMDIRNSIGKEGTVYLTIPAEGEGVVQINVQETLRELSAVSHDKTIIKTGERVIVEEIVSGNVLVVKKI